MTTSHSPNLVFNGKFIKVYSQERTLKNGTKGIFETVKLPDSSCIIPIVDGKIAVAYQTQIVKGTYYSLFGGMNDDGESPLDTAKRELLEEAGLSSEDRELFWQDGVGSMIDKTRYFYIAKNCKLVNIPDLDDGEEMIQTVLLDFDKFIDLIVYGKLNGNQVNVRGKAESYYFMKLILNNQLEEFKKRLFS